MLESGEEGVNGHLGQVRKRSVKVKIVHLLSYQKAITSVTTIQLCPRSEKAATWPIQHGSVIEH